MATATAIWAGVAIITDGVEAEAIITTTDYQIWYSKEAASVGGLLSPQRGRFAPRGLRARKSWSVSGWRPSRLAGPKTGTVGRLASSIWGNRRKWHLPRPSDLHCKNDFIGKTWACRRR
jgi:hypothetical protein